MNSLILMGWLSITLSVVIVSYSAYFLERGRFSDMRDQRPFALSIGAATALLMMEGYDVVRGMVAQDSPEFLHVFVMQLVVLLLQWTILLFVRDYGFNSRCTDCTKEG